MPFTTRRRSCSRQGIILCQLIPAHHRPSLGLTRSGAEAPPISTPAHRLETTFHYVVLSNPRMTKMCMLSGGLAKLRKKGPYRSSGSPRPRTPLDDVHRHLTSASSMGISEKAVRSMGVSPRHCLSVSLERGPRPPPGGATSSPLASRVSRNRVASQRFDHKARHSLALPLWHALAVKVQLHRPRSPWSCALPRSCGHGPLQLRYDSVFRIKVIIPPPPPPRPSLERVDVPLVRHAPERWSGRHLATKSRTARWSIPFRSLHATLVKERRQRSSLRRRSVLQATGNLRPAVGLSGRSHVQGPGPSLG